MSASVDSYTYYQSDKLQRHHSHDMIPNDSDHHDFEQSLSESHFSEEGDVEPEQQLPQPQRQPEEHRQQHQHQHQPQQQNKRGRQHHQHQHQQEDDLVSNKSSMSSMSVFMNSLVGVHTGSEDFSFCLQMDNAKPRDLTPPPQSSSSSSSPSQTPANNNHNHNHAGDNASASVSIARKNNGISRWESTPSKTTAPVAHSTRTRAMRPWRPPSNNQSFSNSASMNINFNNSSSIMNSHSNHNHNSSTTNNSTTNNGSSRKFDAPISRPQRHDSNRSLSTNNAKRPQRYDSNRSLNQQQQLSNRSLNREISLSDLSKQPSARSLNNNNQSPASQQHLPSHHDKSMDLRVLLEYEEDNFDDSACVIEGDESKGVFLKIPSMQSSLWSSASTMTASFRTMASTRSLMSHYSISNHGASTNAGTGSSSHGWNSSSHRSLFLKSEEERPMRPPRRSKSRERHFQSNACERPVRRPVRSPSDRSVLESSTSVLGTSASDNHATNNTATAPTTAAPATAASVVLANTTSACASLLPALNWQDSSGDLSFRLIRSLSEQTLETAVRQQSADSLMMMSTTLDNSTSIHHPGLPGRFLKRTLSDSLLFTSQEFSESFSINNSTAHLVSLHSLSTGNNNNKASDPQ